MQCVGLCLEYEEAEEGKPGRGFKHQLRPLQVFWVVYPAKKVLWIVGVHSHACHVFFFLEIGISHVN